MAYGYCDGTARNVSHYAETRWDVGATRYVSAEVEWEFKRGRSMARLGSGRNSESVRILPKSFVYFRRLILDRLVYDWVLLDQEISLFHDMPTILSISELQALLPHPNPSLFSASSAHAWSTLLSSSSPSHIPTSLHGLFQDFLHDNFFHYSASLTPLTLRLLLHPIQSLLYQVRQLLTCFSDVLSTRNSPTPTLTKASTLTHLE